MMEFIYGLVLISLGIVYGQDDEPIVNNNPDDLTVAIPSDDNEGSWFEQKYIVATMDKHFVLIMGIIGILFFALTLCTIYKCRQKRRNGGYSRQRFNEESDYDTDADIEKQPFNYK
mmetsp:Transcript_31333/g.27552  ORF Transcript_31333/g.27552 Transcript_31333/m.27552 type:complete len:116 (+) Transcript_31333:71-418(+)